MMGLMLLEIPFTFAGRERVMMNLLYFLQFTDFTSLFFPTSWWKFVSVLPVAHYHAQSDALPHAFSANQSAAT
jgi:hypothetical protein